MHFFHRTVCRCAFSFGFPFGDAAELKVIGDVVVEAGGDLVDRANRGVLEAGQGRCVGRVYMQNAAGVGVVPVDGAVDAPG